MNREMVRDRAWTMADEFYLDLLGRGYSISPGDEEVVSYSFLEGRGTGEGEFMNEFVNGLKKAILKYSEREVASTH